jgi:small subunit ribosomal protein S17
MTHRGLNKQRAGVVVSDRMEKTAVVSVERRVMDPKYKKILRRRTRIKAHDESNQCRVGDRVLIVECRPLSRDKRWRVSKVLERSQAVEAELSADASA